MLPWTIAAAALATAAALVMTMMTPRRVESQAPVRLIADVGADVSILDSGAAVALSADGSMLALSAQSGGRTRLYVRRLERFDAMVLPGGDGANNPFFSPDGQWIAFFAAGTLKKISVNGGAAVTLADSVGQRGGTWSEDGTIIFGHTSGGLVRVSSNGGKPEPVTSLLEGEATHRYPQVLPGGKAVLFTSYTSPSGTFDQANIVVQPLPSGPPKIVQRGGYYGRYVPSGHLVYMRNGTLFAVPFDLGQLQVAGETVPVVEDVTSNPTLGAAQFAVSSSGTLVYRTHRGVTGGGVPIAGMGPDGRTTPLRTAPSDWANVLFSPDGRRLAMDISDARQSDVWVYEWARDIRSRA
jgi:serine/threonine-protein kinase